MNNKRRLIIAAAILAVLAIPTMAWAFTGPLAADPPVPNVGDGSLDDDSFGWMSQMHDYMWNNSELPENLPADTADWMNQMSDYMWGDAAADGSYDWMNQMHDYMWSNGESPEDFPSGPCPMGSGIWGER